jgi:addiction module HigA family antidote
VQSKRLVKRKKETNRAASLLRSCIDNYNDIRYITFALTINIAFVFAGRHSMPKTSKSQTTIKKISTGLELTQRRLPKHRPPTHPGEMLLEEFLKPLAVSQSAFAIQLGVSFPRLNEIIHGKRGVTSDTALRLAQVLGMSADFWLGLQSDWDLWQALHGKNTAEIAALEPLRI